MGREVRRVPANWQHPVEVRVILDRGHKRYGPVFKALFNGRGFTDRCTKWDDDSAQWANGLRRGYGEGNEREWVAVDAENVGAAFQEWGGTRPNREYYMPEFPDDQCTHFQMYETTSEGTPISPVFATPEELAQWACR